jgi:hypothetical protein
MGLIFIFLLSFVAGVVSEGQYHDGQRGGGRKQVSQSRFVVFSPCLFSFFFALPI